MQYRKHNILVNLPSAATYNTVEGWQILFGEINELALDENSKKRLVAAFKDQGLTLDETASDLTFSTAVLDAVYSNQNAAQIVAEEIKTFRAGPFTGSTVGVFDKQNSDLYGAINTLLKDNHYQFEEANKLLAEDLANKKSNRNLPISLRDRLSTIGTKQLIFTAAILGLVGYGCYKIFNN